MTSKVIEELILEKEMQIKKNEQEIKRLQAEITEYKKISNEINSEINKTYTKEEKIKIFMDYFKGREDLYAIQRIQNDKVFYNLTCANFWSVNCLKRAKGSCEDCKHKKTYPLTQEIYEKHFTKQESAIGIYPLLPNNKCYFLAFDFDDKTGKLNILEDVKAFQKVTERYHIDTITERSRSGSGFHIWLFFEEQIPAVTARKLGSLLLSKAMEEKEDFKIQTFDRMFPTQEVLKENGVGNLIALPYQKDAVQNGNTVFLNRNFERITNSIATLQNTKKLTLKEVDTLIQILTEETIKISYEEENINNNKDVKIEYPNSIDVELNNMIYIKKEGLSLKFKALLRKKASFFNSQYFKNQRLRLSNYKTPMIIDCSELDTNYLKLPRGCFEVVRKICEENNITMNIEDKRNNGKKIKVSFKGKLREKQQEAAKEILKQEIGILQAPTGFGKTVVSCYLIGKRKINTLIIVPNVNLLKQWQESLKEFLNTEKIGQLGDNKKDITDQIDVATVQSLWRKGKTSEILKNYGMIIFDECHHSASFMNEQVLKQTSAKYVYGLSATPYREDGLAKIIRMQCGEVRNNINEKEYNQNLGFDLNVIVRRRDSSERNMRIIDYQLNEINELLMKDTERNEWIMEDIKSEFLKGKSILILTKRVEHIYILYKSILKFTENCLIYHGNNTKEELVQNEKIKSHLTANKIIISTTKYVGEGFDDPSLDVLFLVMPSSDQKNLTQYLGRILRKRENKKEALVYDYVDNSFKMTRGMYRKRKETYEKLGYKILEEKNISMEDYL